MPTSLAGSSDFIERTLPESIRGKRPIDTIAVVETPERVRLEFKLAGPAQRAAAYAIDLVVRSLLALALALVSIAGGRAPAGMIHGASIGIVLVVLFAVEWGYYVLLETLMGGRSIGKRALRLRVVKHDGLPLGFGDSVLRNLLRAADFLPGFYAIGLVVMMQDGSFRRLGDLVAGTLVVSEEAGHIERPIRITPPPSAAELLEIPERLPLLPREVEAIELFLRRSGELAPARELELAEIVAPTFARRIGVRYRHAPRFLALLHDLSARRASSVPVAKRRG